MILDIDIAKLKQDRQKALDEAEKLTALIEAVEKYSRPPVETKPQPISPPLATVRMGAEPRRGFTAGLLRAITLALHTGPSTEAELVRALAWDASHVRNVIGSMLKFRLCFISETGNLRLSEEGQKQATWFLQNSNRLTHNPNNGKVSVNE